MINLRFQVRRGYLVPFSSSRQHIRITIPVTLFRDQSRGNSKVRSVARPLRASVTSGLTHVRYSRNRVVPRPIRIIVECAAYLLTFI